MLGGSADLAPSNNTAHQKRKAPSGPGAADRNIHFGVREHAMGSILNGLSHTRGADPFRRHLPDFFRLYATAHTFGRHDGDWHRFTYSPMTLSDLAKTALPINPWNSWRLCVQSLT